MASLLDVAGLAFFLPVFVFILIFAILLALLEKTELFGKNQRVLNVTAAFTIAAIAVFAGKLTGLISEVIPWIVFLIVLLVLIFGMYKFFGMEKTEEIWALFGEPTPFILVMIIVIVGISVVFEGSLSPYGEGTVTVTESDGTVVTQPLEGSANPRSETIRTLSHPRILGALFILVVAASTVHYLTKKFEPRGK